ncbi:MAG TPA: glycine cleavage system protein GcvH [Mycobacteriales bacterium]|nr:glycine cleavage system protein GcvH [Mycobacteriales bacterium]
MVVPEELSYTAEHEWVRREDDGTVRIGITDYAQEQLGDIVFVSLPATGSTVAAGGVLGEVESTKSVSEIYAPIAGEVVARNEDLENRPELINSEPYAGGWIVAIRPAAEDDVSGLLDAAAYQQLLDTAS